jgi:hypothetical protein
MWVEVLYYLDNTDSITLWMTGSLLLRQRLGAQGGWKTLKIGGSKGPPFLRIWPRALVNNLQGLSVLRVSPPHVDALLPMLKPSLEDIQQLPKSITSLRFDFVDPVADAWLSHLPPQLTRLSLPFNRAISGEGLHQLPASLEVLDLKSNLRIRSGLHLPRNLLEYTCSDVALRPSVMLSSELPSGLVSLKITTKKKGQPIWSMTRLECLASHPSLTSLEVEYIGASDSVLRELPLPRTLTSLTLTGNPSIADSAFPLLPAGLRVLRLFFKDHINLQWSDEAMALLPRTLTHLQVAPSRRRFRQEYLFAEFPTFSTLTPECIALLPAELKVLWLRLVPGPKFSFSVQPGRRGTTHQRRAQMAELQAFLDIYTPFLPAGLVEMSLSMRLGSNRFTVWPCNRHLPLSITSLPFCKIRVNIEKRQFGNDDDVRSALLGVMTPANPPHAHPSSASSASTAAGLSEAAMNENDEMNAVPDIVNLANFNISKSEYQFATLELNDSAALPDPLWFQTRHHSRLRRLAWNYNNIHIRPRLPGMASGVGRTQLPLEDQARNPSFSFFELLDALPRTLTSLTLFASEIEDEDIMALPDSLTELILSYSEKLTDECLPAMPHNLKTLQIRGSHSIRGDIYPWPKKLTCLMLGLIDTPPGQFLQPKLPPSLTNLQLDCNSISHNLFKHGPPPLLTALKISMECPHLSITEFFKTLPETLVKFSLPELDFYDDDIQYLPRSLRSFKSDGGGAHVTGDSADCWPPLLRKLFIRGDLFTNDAVSKLPGSLTYLTLTMALLCDMPTLVFGPAIQKWSICSLSGNNYH